ncbi:MAG: hypothetical protein SPE01_03810 [Candidatus Spyradocola sp.]|nr:hypothetical protein [Candidatus Spyradocola sp.]
MAKLRKMLGRADAPVCAELMHLMDTQSAATLARWAVEYAAQRALPLCPSVPLQEAVDACRAHLSSGTQTLQAVKPLIHATQAAAREESDPVRQAAARAVATACASVQTPTSALGFLFYTAAAIAYSEIGLNADAQRYDALAEREFQAALQSLRKCAIPDEPHPARLN